MPSSGLFEQCSHRNMALHLQGRGFLNEFLGQGVLPRPASKPEAEDRVKQLFCKTPNFLPLTRLSIGLSSEDWDLGSDTDEDLETHN